MNDDRGEPLPIDRDYFKAFLPLLNRHNTRDGLELLRSLPRNVAHAAFFDPQYKGVLDHLRYGNECESRQRRRSQLPFMSAETIEEFVGAISSRLIPGGMLFLWADKYGLLDQGRIMWSSADAMAVDLMVWDTERMGMGHRTRHSFECLVVLQRPPIRARGVWTDNGIRDVWRERVDKRSHPHAKPVRLQQRLIEACVPERGIVLDPAAGSYSVYEAARRAGRQFLGCDVLEWSSLDNE